MCYIMTANGFTLLTSEERDKLYGISSKDNKNKKGEKPVEWSEDDERIKKRLINLVNEIYNNTNYITFLEHKELLTWLEKLDDNVEL